MTLKQEFKVFV